MSLVRSHARWVIVASFAVAFLLSVIPMSGFLAWLRPEWVVLVLIYWVLAMPHAVGLLTAWSVGLLLDVLEGTLLGQNALAMIVVAGATIGLYQRLRMFPPLQQSLVIFVIVGFNQLVCHWINGAVGVAPKTMLFLLPSLISALIWPFVFYSLRSVRRIYRVA